MISSTPPVPLASQPALRGGLSGRPPEGRLTVEIERLGLRTRIRGRTVRAFLVTALLTALAKASAVLPGYSVDDYHLALRQVPTSSMLKQGRFGEAALARLLHFLQLDPAHSRPLFVLVTILVAAAFATLIVRHWRLERGGWLPVAAASIVANHPYTVELFTFRGALGTAAAAIALLCLLLLPERWSPRLVLLGSGLFALALSLHQIVLHYCLMIVAVGAAVGFARRLAPRTSRRWPRMVGPHSGRRLLHHRNGGLLACALLGTAFYVGLGWLLTLALQVDLSRRTQILAADQIDERALALLGTLHSRLVGVSPLLTQPTKLLLLLVLLTAMVGLISRAQRWQRLQALLVASAAIALLLGSLVWSVGIVLVLRDYWVPPRVMVHIGIFWAGTLAIGYLCLERRGRRALGVLAAAIVLSFLGANNRVLNEQLRLNARDASKATRILARLEAHPDFSAIEAVAVGGVDWTYQLPFETMDHDLNISAFGARWAQVAILREISGYDLKEMPPEVDAASSYCRDVQPWPGPEAVTVRDGLAIICIGPG